MSEREVWFLMKFVERVAHWFGYVRADIVPQTSIAFKDEDRAHIVMQLGDYHLVGEVDCFHTTPTAAEPSRQLITRPDPDPPLR